MKNNVLCRLLGLERRGSCSNASKQATNQEVAQTGLGNLCSRPHPEKGMRKGRSRTTLACVALLTSTWVGACGPELTRISVIDKVRIIGVQKSAPYARPGEQVTLRLLWEDGAESPPRQVEPFFAFWCVNPAGDLFSECLSDIGRQPQISAGSSEFVMTIPEDSLRTNLPDPKFPPYGVAYVFYGACAGTLKFFGQGVGSGGVGGAFGSGGAGGAALELPEDLPEVGGDVPASGLLPTCVDENGAELGVDNFILGYSAIFIYEDFRNENPKIDGFQVAGQDVMVDCVDAACTEPFEIPALTGCEPGVACLDACPEDASSGCPEVELGPVIDPISIEKDDIARVAYDNDIEEALWVSYFVDRGSLSSELRLVNDAETGFNSAYQTKLVAPSEPGPLRIWAAVRDNRGGISWVRVPAYVRPAAEAP